MKDREPDTIALWSIYAHAYNAFPFAPRLGARAATKRCGKTELLRRFYRLVRRPLHCDDLSAAVMFRLIDKLHPTPLLDELDNELPDDKGALLSIINSGYSSHGSALGASVTNTTCARTRPLRPLPTR